MLWRVEKMLRVTYLNLLYRWCSDFRRDWECSRHRTRWRYFAKRFPRTSPRDENFKKIIYIYVFKLSWHTWPAQTVGRRQRRRRRRQRRKTTAHVDQTDTTEPNNGGVSGRRGSGVVPPPAKTGVPTTAVTETNRRCLRPTPTASRIAVRSYKI